MELDAEQVERPRLKLGRRANLVLRTLIAATRGPARLRSLTLIEPPLYYLVPGDPEVARLECMGNAVLTHGLDADAATLRQFLPLAGAPQVDDGPVPDEVVRGVERAQGGQLPSEARPALEQIRDAGIPSLVASGGHAPGLERIRDALSTVLYANGWSCPAPGTSSLRRQASSTGSTSSSSPQRERSANTNPASA